MVMMAVLVMVDDFTKDHLSLLRPELGEQSMIVVRMIKMNMGIDLAIISQK